MGYHSLKYRPALCRMVNGQISTGCSDSCDEIFPMLSGNCVLQEWQDERLTWNPEDFGNVTDIIVRADKLWLPELAVMNGFVIIVTFSRVLSLVDLLNAAMS